MHPKELSIFDFTYTLPPERIAAYPLPGRDASRLLVYDKGKISSHYYHELDSIIPPGSLLVFNNTKVVEARLLFKKPTGSTIELFCLEPHEQYADITTALQQEKKVLWKCLVGGASKWKRGQVLVKRIEENQQILLLQAKYIEKRTDHFIIEFSWSPSHYHFAEVLHMAGAIPLPPYIKRAAEITDAERYQTVYALADGSVAAPTAGLHFSPSLLERLHDKKIKQDFVTLHVGAGTFKPVKASIMAAHEMHGEQFEVSAATIQHLLKQLPGTIIPVGTTSLRTLESLYWLGVKLIRASAGHVASNLEYESFQPSVLQWEPYELTDAVISPEHALTALLNWMQSNKLEVLQARTQVIIAPGYQPKIANALITNFHQPQSTLLLLIAGINWR